MQPLCWVIRMLLLSALLPWSSTGQFHVMGPKAPIIALVGREAVLSCHLDPVMDAQNMEVRWYRNEPSGLVHHYGGSQDYIEQQMPAYQGRTEFLKENITKGQAALRIQSISLLDNGEYSCLFESSTYYERAHFTVLVTVSGVYPHIQIEPGNTNEVKLTCTSTGWFPEPEMQWRDLKGQHLTTSSETKTREENGLFRVETSITVESSRGSVSCLIRNRVLIEEKEVSISVADAMFPRTSPWMVVFVVFLSLLVVVAALGAIYVVRARKAKDPDREGIEGLIKAQRYAEDIILDKNTAHPNLKVSDDGKSVIWHSEKQTVPGSQQFNILLAVLGQNRFSGGEHYWMVSVSEGSTNNWILGLCVDSVPRNVENLCVCPARGFWTLCLQFGEYKALTDDTIQILHVPTKPKIVGIFLHYDKGSISFFDVINWTILYTYKSSFTQPLKPYFQLTPGKNIGFTIL